MLPAASSWFVVAVAWPVVEAAAAAVVGSSIDFGMALMMYVGTLVKGEGTRRPLPALPAPTTL
jgi:hypothetical protein